MGQPVTLSDELVDDARAVVPFSQRTLEGQIEFWAVLGKSIEPLLRRESAIAPQISGEEQPLSRLLSETASAHGRARLEATLNSLPYPHYQPVPGQPDLVVRIEENGRRTVGRFVGRIFEPVRGDL